MNWVGGRPLGCNTGWSNTSAAEDHAYPFAFSTQYVRDESYSSSKSGFWFQSAKIVLQLVCIFVVLVQISTGWPQLVLATHLTQWSACSLLSVITTERWGKQGSINGAVILSWCSMCLDECRHTAQSSIPIWFSASYMETLISAKIITKMWKSGNYNCCVPRWYKGAFECKYLGFQQSCKHEQMGDKTDNLNKIYSSKPF